MTSQSKPPYISQRLYAEDLATQIEGRTHQERLAHALRRLPAGAVITFLTSENMIVVVDSEATRLAVMNLFYEEGIYILGEEPDEESEELDEEPCKKE